MSFPRTVHSWCRDSEGRRRTRTPGAWPYRAARLTIHAAWTFRSLDAAHAGAWGAATLSVAVALDANPSADPDGPPLSDAVEVRYAAAVEPTSSDEHNASILHRRQAWFGSLANLNATRGLGMLARGSSSRSCIRAVLARSP